MSADEYQFVTLRVLSYRDQPSSLAHTFGKNGGTLGRSTESDLVLADASKFISRTHARVVWRKDGFALCSLATNPVTIDDVPLLTGQEARLTHLARIRIGDYLLEVILPHIPAAATVGELDRSVPTPSLYEPPRTAAAAPDPRAAIDIFAPPAEADALGLDLFGGALGAGAAAGQRAVPAHAFRGAESDHLAPENQSFASFRDGGANPPIPVDYDPLADLQPRAGPGTSGTRAGPGPFGDDALVAAFLKGLGQPDLKTDLNPLALFELAGAMLREATAGTMGALLARSLTKRESRVDLTMLVRQSNNPLKFFPDAGSALAQMLGRPNPAYMSPSRAFSSAYDDLKAHELAVIAAMRAAMSEVLAQFDPAAIEKKLPPDGAMEKMFSVNRKARCWDRLVREYGEIAPIADDRFQRHFGEKFSAAYEEQLNRIRRAKR